MFPVVLAARVAYATGQLLAFFLRHGAPFSLAEVSVKARMSKPRSLNWLIVTLDSPQQFHVAKRGGVERLVASPAPSLPPVVPLRVPSPRSNRGVPVACTCVRITGQEKTSQRCIHGPLFVLQSAWQKQPHFLWGCRRCCHELLLYCIESVEQKKYKGSSSAS